MEMIQLFEYLRTNFNARVERDPVFRQSVISFNKRISFSLTDDDDYAFTIINGRVPEITTGRAPNYDIRIITDKEHLIELLNGNIDPMKAMMTGKLKINGSLPDVAWLKRFLDLNKSTIAGIMNDYSQ